MVNSTNAIVAGRPKSTGGAYSAIAGTALATDATTALNAAFKTMGYIGDDGLTETIGRETDTIKAWGGDVVKVVQTDFAVTYKLTIIETLTGDAAKAVFGTSNVTATAGGPSNGARLAISVKSTPLTKGPWVFEVQDGLVIVRIVVPNGQVIAVDDVTYNDGSVIGYPITIQAFPDASGINVYKYSDDGITVP